MFIRSFSRLRRKKQEPARFTVEASLLMLLILPVLIAVIIAGFYIHDRTFLQGVSSEMSAMGSNLRLYENRNALLSSRASGRISHTLVWSRSAGANASAGKGSAEASCSASFSVPGLAAKLLGSSTLDISTASQRRLLDPAALIWQVRSVKYLVSEHLP